MENTYFAVVTDLGARKMLEAINENKKVNITSFAAGDGGGEYYIPTTGMTELKNEVWRGTINACKISEESENLLIIESVMPSDVGGFTIREMGVFDEDGELIAICNTPDTQKVRVSDGVVHELSLSIEIALSNTDSVQLIVDPSVVMATKKDIQILENKIIIMQKSLSDVYENEENIERAFYAIYTNIAGYEEDESMSLEEITNALSTRWNGETSQDETAMSAADITNALNTAWNGETSPDKTALTAWDIYDVIG
jgi:Phage-related tail fibre protein